MTVLSQRYPGITTKCTNCVALLGIDPHQDIYENRYVYCPICKEKLELQIYESSWKYSVEKNNIVEERKT